MPLSVIVLVPVAEMLKGVAPPKFITGLEFPIVNVVVLAAFEFTVVNVPLIVSAPLVNVKVELLVLPPPAVYVELIVKLLVTFMLLSVEVQVMLELPLPPGVTVVITNDPQLNVPAPLIVTASFPFEFPDWVTALVTVKVIPLFIVRPSALAPAEALSIKVNELHEVLTVTVTVCPLAIITSSPAPGTTPPDQVPVAFQFPEAADVMVAAFVNVAKLNNNANSSNAFGIFETQVIVDINPFFIATDLYVVIDLIAYFIIL